MTENKQNIHFGSILNAHAGQTGVLEDAAVEELHDVEGGADDAVILAQAVGPRHRHVGMARQRGKDAILAVDLVRRLGQQLARRLLAQHEPRARRHRGKQVGRVGLAVAKL